jgi:hypothetical protein
LYIEVLHFGRGICKIDLGGINAEYGASVSSMLHSVFKDESGEDRSLIFVCTAAESRPLKLTVYELRYEGSLHAKRLLHLLLEDESEDVFFGQSSLHCFDQETLYVNIGHQKVLKLLVSNIMEQENSGDSAYQLSLK